MSIINAPANGGTVYGSVAADQIIGSAKNDILFGLAGDDIINGGDGDDVISGGSGADHLDGGTGINTVTFADATAGVTLAFANTDVYGIGGQFTNHATGGIGGDAAGDTYTNFQIFIGTSFDDHVYGADTPMTYYLGAGNDVFDNSYYSVTVDTIYAGAGNDVVWSGAGNDYLDGGTGNDQLFGELGDDTLVGGQGADNLDGGEGIDTADYSASNAAVNVSLSTGQGHGGDAEGDTLVSIENLTGSAFNDILTGDAGNNVIVGGAGDDVISGGAGADKLDGGAGVDTVTFANAKAGVTLAFTAMDEHGIGDEFANHAAGGIAGDATGDTYANFEVFIGSAFDDKVGGAATAMTYHLGAGNDVFDNVETQNVVDTVYGDEGNDTIWTGAGNDYLNGGTGDDKLFGENGNDILVGGQGADALNGGDGIDTADYSASAAGVNVSLLTGQGHGGDAEGDTLVLIENLTGSNFNDTLIGDAGNNVLIAGAGDDVLVGGAGADVLNGGDGIDTADYSTSSAAVNVNLETGVAHGGDAEGDTLISIENLVGSKFDDVLVGDANVNKIYGGDGNDTITGGHNDDFMYGGNGNDTFLVEWSYHGDTYDGGDGIDTFNADVPVLNGYKQEIDLATGTNNWEDHFISIENLVGSANDDKFWGTDGVNVFWGRNGNDLLDGRGGDDKLYGESGDDTLLGGAGNDLLDGGTGNDILVGGIGADILIGGAGIDVADYSTSSAAVNVNLNTGTGFGGDAEGDTLSQIENLIGSKFNDTLTGDAGNNTIDGGAGNDVIVGSKGNDTLIGGAGNDTVDYSASSACMTVNLGLGTATGCGGKADTLQSIENVVGSIYADFITGDAAANNLFGGAGNDHFYGSGGGDHYDGGAGSDWIDYRSSLVAVNVNLMTGIGQGGLAQGDTYTSIENIKGSAGDDTLIGDNNANVIYGYAGKDHIEGGGGNDVIYSGGGGDYIDGGAGIDTLSYSDSWSKVVVNLTTGIGQGGAAAFDTILNIENLVGSKFDDVLTGDAGNNTLNGGAGKDILHGGAGADLLIGGSGADVLDGGDGVDTASYSNAHTGVTLSLLTGGTINADASQNGIQPVVSTICCPDDLLANGDGAAPVDGSYTAVNGVTDATGDTYIGIENVLGSAFNDKITGDAGDNRLNGGAGNDILNGGGGNDMLIGGIGNDLLTGGAGADVFQFSADFGNDTITDFWFGLGRTDRVQLIGTDIHSWADVLSHINDTANGLVLSVDAGHDSITFAGLHLNQLVADDFLFA